MNPLGRRGPRAAWVLPCAAAALAMTMMAGCSSDDDDDELPPVAEAPQPEPPAPEPEEPKTCLQLSDTGELIDPLAPPAEGAPEVGSGYASKGVVYARTYMAIAANPIANVAVEPPRPINEPAATAHIPATNRLRSCPRSSQCPVAEVLSPPSSATPITVVRVPVEVPNARCKVGRNTLGQR